MKNKFLMYIAIGLIILTVAYFYLLFKPTLMSLKNYYKFFSQIKSNVFTTTLEYKNIQDLNKNLISLRNKGASYRSRLVSSQNLPAFLEELSKIAQESDVKIISIKPLKESDNPEKKDLFTRMPIQIEASCGYHQLGKFINTLESHTRFIKINEIKIKANPENNKLHTVTISIETYALS